MSDNLDNLSPSLRAIVEKILAESGGKVTVSSGYRTNQQQQALYEAYQNGTGNLAAKPGTSKHEHGEAIDWGGDLQLAAQLSAKYGLIASVPGEPWHYTLGGEGSGVVKSAGPGVYDRGEDTNPQDVLANRMQSILRIIGTKADGSSDVSSPSFDDPVVDQEFAPGDVDGNAVAAGMGNQSSGASGAKGEYQKYAAKKSVEMGWNPSEMGALITLWNKESGWNPTADNPTSTAYGIAQFLNGTWAGTGIARTSDPFQQIDAGLIYIKNRYGSPSAALAFHLENGFY